ncbi:MAG TPA: MFS transporter [Caulifigura sp.]|nr:MFS transporter [Caulifigura sp.]
MRARYAVLAMLVGLSVITYMDRVCISNAATRIQKDLGISDWQWGWVLGVFSIGYGIFEVPTGAWGDRVGQRRVLTRIVVWWSVFTMLTGAVEGFVAMLVVRFLFSMGEAGAYPNATGSVGRWFPPEERARAQGVIWSAARLSGAVTPAIVLYLILALGWRMTFVVFGLVGIVWAVVWRIWYRDFPQDHSWVSEEELQEIGPSERHAVGVRDVLAIFAHKRMWLIMAMFFGYTWAPGFFIGWFPKYLETGLGFTESEKAYWAFMPFFAGAVGNLLGGWLSDRLVHLYGKNVGRRLQGALCLVASSGLMFGSAMTGNREQAVILLALSFGVCECMLPCAFALCLDVGGGLGGAVSGAMNTAGQAGVLCGTVLFGYLVETYREPLGTQAAYQLPLYSIAAMILFSGVLFALINPNLSLAESEVMSPSRESDR